MKRSTITSFIALMTVLQSVAHADLMDLPDPNEGGGSIPSTPATPGKTPSQGQTQFAGSVRLNGISRKTGGVLYKIKLQDAMNLKRIDLRVVTSKVKIYEATLVTEQGQRIEIQNFRATAVLETDSLTASENLTANSRISSIEILAESFSAEADVMITAVSTGEIPKMFVVAEPVAPPVVPTPVPPVTEPIPPEPDFGNIDLDPYNPPGNDPFNPGGNIGGDIFVNFNPGERVLYDGQLVGTVVRFYNDGQVEVNVDGRGLQLIHSSRLEKATSCYGEVCQGETVQYSNQSAQVITVFQSGTVLIAMNNGARYLVDASYLTKEIQCNASKSVCVGDAILFQNQYTGMVIGLLGNGLVQISLTGTASGIYTASEGQIATSLRCSEGANPICSNERVMYGNRGAIVLGVYSNGLARLQVDGQRNPVMVQTAYIVKRLNCAAGFCVGQKVFYGREKATIKEIFSNGTARITIGGVLKVNKDYLVQLGALRF